MRLAAIVGTRPEIIKMRPVLRSGRLRGHEIALIHAGQHYDFNMSGVFFEELGIPEPDHFLGIGAGTHAAHLASGATALERVLIDNAPDALLVVGDTDTTLLGTVVAAQMRIPVAHVESGVRSFDWTMPEEIIRRAVDSIARLCFAPTERAYRRLCTEGRGADATLVGDTLVEVAEEMAPKATGSAILSRAGVVAGQYAVATVHRPATTDDPVRLREIFRALSQLGLPVVAPLHPRTRARAERAGILDRLPAAVVLSEPLGYLDFLHLLRSARLVLTDSGGVQQEASFFNVPVLTMRENTEWVETLEAGKNVLVGTDGERIVAIARGILGNPDRYERMARAPSPFRTGAGARIVETLERVSAQGALAYRGADFIRDGVPSE